VARGPFMPDPPFVPWIPIIIESRVMLEVEVERVLKSATPPPFAFSSQGVRVDAACGGGEGPGQGEHHPLGPWLLRRAAELAHPGLLRRLAHEARPRSGPLLQARSTPPRRAHEHARHQGHTLAREVPAVLAHDTPRRLPRP
jgi:hypothetical protein